MRAARNPFLLVDHDRYGWVDADPDPEAMERRRQRGYRRDVVNAFLKDRKYWTLMRWLGAKLPSHRRFMTIGEALALARLDYALNPESDDKRMVVVVARYFNLAGSSWL